MYMYVQYKTLIHTIHKLLLQIKPSCTGTIKAHIRPEHEMSSLMDVSAGHMDDTVIIWHVRKNSRAAGTAQRTVIPWSRSALGHGRISSMPGRPDGG